MMCMFAVLVKNYVSVSLVEFVFASVCCNVVVVNLLHEMSLFQKALWLKIQRKMASVSTSGDPLSSLESSLRGWLVARRWTMAQQVAYFRMSRAMPMQRRQQRLCRDVVLAEKDCLQPPTPVAGVDFSVELTASLDGIQEEEKGLPPGVLDLRSHTLAEELRKQNEAMPMVFEESPTDRPAEDENVEPEGTTVTPEVSEAFWEGVEVSVAEHSKPRDLGESAGSAPSDAPIEKNEADMATSEATTSQPESLISFRIVNPKAKIQAKWPKVFGKSVF